MKNLLLTLVALCAAVGSHADTAKSPPTDANALATTPDVAPSAAVLAPSTLVVFRPRFSPPVAFKPIITIAGRQSALLPPAQHLEFVLKPGDYELLADWGRGHGVGDTQVTLALQPGVNLRPNHEPHDATDYRAYR